MTIEEIKNEFRNSEEKYLASMYDLDDAYMEAIYKLYDKLVADYLCKKKRNKKKFFICVDDQIKFIKPDTLDSIYVYPEYILKSSNGEIIIEGGSYKRKFIDLSTEEKRLIINIIISDYFSDETYSCEND